MIWPRLSCPFQEYWGMEGEADVSIFLGPILSCLDDLGLPVPAQGQSQQLFLKSAPWHLTPKSTFWNRPSSREASGLWGSGKDFGPAWGPVTVVKASCIHWWLFTNYPMSWSCRPLWRIRFGWAPFSRSPPPCLDPCALDHLYGYVHTQGFCR